MVGGCRWRLDTGEGGGGAGACARGELGGEGVAGKEGLAPGQLPAEFAGARRGLREQRVGGDRFGGGGWVGEKLGGELDGVGFFGWLFAHEDQPAFGAGAGDVKDSAFFALACGGGVVGGWLAGVQARVQGGGDG